MNKAKKINAVEELERLGAAQRGHFFHNDLSHVEWSVDLRHFYPQTMEVGPFVDEMVHRYITRAAHEAIETVIAPGENGGNILSHLVAYSLTTYTGRQVHAVWAENEPGCGWRIFHGFEKYLQGKRVLVVDGVIVDGRATQGAINIARSTGGFVQGVESIWDWGSLKPMEMRFSPDQWHSLVEGKRWAAGIDCPTCKAMAADIKEIAAK